MRIVYRVSSIARRHGFWVLMRHTRRRLAGQQRPEKHWPSWQRRRDAIIGLVSRYEPDFFALQHLTSVRFRGHWPGQQLLVALPTYKGVRSRASMFGLDGFGLLYDSSKWSLMGSQSVKFEGSPDRRNGSWGERYLVVTLCHHVSGRHVRVYVSRLRDGDSHEYRHRSAAQLSAAAVESVKGGVTTIVCVDINDCEQSKTSRALTSGGELRDSFRHIRPNSDRTQHDYDVPATVSGRRNDLILVSREARVHAAEVITEKFEGILPSSHYPVAARLVVGCED